MSVVQLEGDREDPGLAGGKPNKWQLPGYSWEGLGAKRKRTSELEETALRLYTALLHRPLLLQHPMSPGCSRRACPLAILVMPVKSQGVRNCRFVLPMFGPTHEDAMLLPLAQIFEQSRRLGSLSSLPTVPSFLYFIALSQCSATSSEAGLPFT